MEKNNKLEEICKTINIIKKYKNLDMINCVINISNTIFEDKNNIMIINLAIKDALILSDKYFINIIYKKTKYNIVENDYNVLNESIDCLKLTRPVICMLDYITNQFDTFDTLIHMLNNDDTITTLVYLYNIIIYFKNIIQSTLIIFLDNVIKISVIINNNNNIQIIELNKLNKMINNCNMIMILIHSIQKNIEDRMIILCDANIDNFDDIILGIIDNNAIMLLECYIKNLIMLL